MALFFLWPVNIIHHIGQFDDIFFLDSIVKNVSTKKIVKNVRKLEIIWSTTSINYF